MLHEKVPRWRKPAGIRLGRRAEQLPELSIAASRLPSHVQSVPKESVQEEKLDPAVERRLTRGLARAITDFDMIADGDRVMVCVSGGKDSYTMLHLLRALMRKAPISFSLVVVNIDQGHPGYPADRLRRYMAKEEYDFTMIEEDTYSIVTDKIPEGKTYCSLCSRLRRGILYTTAKKMGCTKIALGHHRDDILQTLLLNLFFAGQLAAMPPKLVSSSSSTREDKHVVIRPLAYCAEEDILAYSKAQAFPILPCDLCGSQDNLQRKIVGSMLNDLEDKHPGIKNVMLAALQNVRPSHLLDKDLWKTLGLEASVETSSSSGESLQGEGEKLVAIGQLLRRV
jgi:tRNA 2-thiocytidine biosynthesis protein TtcA